jgi:mono/diheme cytochrome c family protein
MFLIECQRQPDRSAAPRGGRQCDRSMTRSVLAPPRRVWLGVLLLVTGGCTQRMSDQPRIEPLEASALFADRMGSRHPVVGTVPRGSSRHEIVNHSSHFLTGTVEGVVVDELPPEVLERRSLGEVLERGQQRFNVFCVYCHDQLGTGNGFIPQRGYPSPPTYHSPRVRSLRLGEIFRVITNGKGRMPPYGPQVVEADRWAIAAYIRALQFSQYASVSDLEGEDARAVAGLAGGDPTAAAGEMQ